MSSENQPQNTPRHKPLILLVDDEKAHREMLAEVIQEIGFDTAEAQDGQQALSMFQRVHPDLVLMDARMPVMSGFDACSYLRRLPGGESIPILMLTGLNDPDSIDRGFEAGASDYITKPIHVGILINRVQTIIKSRQTEAALNSIRELMDNALTNAPFLYRLLSNLPGMAYRSNHHPVWQMEYVSTGCLELTGYYPNDLINNHRIAYTNLIHPDDREKMWETINASLEEQKSFQVIYRIVTADGTEKWVWEQGRSITQENDQQIVEGFITDITERRNIELALLQERTLMRTVIDNLADYIFAKNAEGRFIVSNMANALYMDRKHPSEIVGKLNADFYPPEIATRFDTDDQVVMQEGKPSYHWEEETIDSKTGAKRWYSITKAPLPDPEGNVVGLVGMIRDITEAKKGEEEMRLAHESLIELSRLKSHFLLKMSHELRTPLNSIIGYTQMLLQGLNGPLNEKQLDRLERVAQNGQNLLELINDMLDLSRIQTDNMELSLEQINVRAVINECVSAYLPLAQQRNLSIEAKIGSELPLIIADRAGVTKVMMHLIGNGLKFTHQGGVTIEGRLLQPQDSLPFELENKESVWTLLTVRDTGIGISPTEVDKLFDEFRQVDSSPSREYEGTGLGLAIAYKLVKLMQGHIWLSSELGKGTTFHVVLPAA